jgi:hypothetical protein
MGVPDIRVSDRDRDAAVDRLRAASAEGRLEADELEDRVRAALAARTRGDLDALFADLPAPQPAPPPAPERSQMLRQRTAAFLTPNVVCILIWAATGAGSFWPVWVLLGTGIAFAVFLVRYVLGVEDDD